MEPQTKSYWDYYKDAVKDNAKAFGRGVWNGTNALVQGTGALSQGINNITSNIASAPWKAFSKTTGWSTDGIQRFVTAPMRWQNKATQAVQDKVNDWNKLVQTTYKYDDPESFGVRYNNTVGTLVPIAMGSYYGAKIPGISRAVTPVRSGDVAAAAAGTVGRIPVIGKALTTPLNWMASGSKAAKTYNAITNAAAWGLPTADYAFGLTRQQEGDSKLTRAGKRALSYLPSVASLANPAAFSNALINRSNARVEPFAEAIANSATNVVPGYASASRGVIPPYVERAFDALRAKDIDYDRVIQYNDKLLRSQSLGDALNMTRDEIKDSRNNAQLRWAGLQPTAGNKLVDYIIGRDNNGIAESALRGFNKAVADNPELVERIMGSDFIQRLQAMREPAMSAANVAGNIRDDLRGKNYGQAINRMYTDVPPVIEQMYGPQGVQLYKDWLTGADVGTRAAWGFMTPEEQNAAINTYTQISERIATNERRLADTLEALRSGTIGVTDGWRDLQQSYTDSRNNIVDIYNNSSPLQQDLMRYMWRITKAKADNWWHDHRDQLGR